MKKRIILLLLTTILALSSLLGCKNKTTKKEEKKKVTIKIDHDYRTDDLGNYLMKKYPDVEFDIVLGRGGVTYALNQAENNDLPDIMISSSTWGRAGVELNQYLYDLSKTDIASSFYSVYLDNYTNSDGSIYWLPGCSAIEGIMANKTLFDQYGIDLPTDYQSFVEVCNKFTELGIRPYASDYKYDYTCAYLLQSWSIPLLQSKKGKTWRVAFEEGETDILDEAIGLEMFEKLQSFFELTGVTEADAKRGYGATMNDLVAGNVAMIRQSTNNSGYYDAGLTDLVILPYFGATENDNWYFTTPSYAVAMSGSLKGSNKEDVCLSIVRDLFSQECMDMFASEVQSFSAYNKGITFEVKDEFKNIVPYVESNHMYTYLSQDNFIAASKLAVQMMIKGEATPSEALKAFNERLVQTAEEEPTVATIDVSYSRTFSENGNEALSAIVNTFAKIKECDIMLAPYSMHTSGIYSGDYTQTEIDNLIYGGGVNFYSRKVSGYDIKRIIKAAVEGCGMSRDPINLSTLPATYGCQMVISKGSDGSFVLEDVLIDGKSIEDSKMYNFVYTDNTPELLRIALGWDKAAHDGLDVGVEEGKSDFDYDKYEGFTYSSTHVATYWIEYFKSGSKIASPSNYIDIK